jgi:uncharacterized membrane protein YoaK (UPF0700 family)
VRIAVLAMLVFAAGVLLASFIHRSLFSASQMPDRLWFGGFIIATIMLGVLSFLAARPEKPTRVEAQEAIEKSAL